MRIVYKLTLGFILISLLVGFQAYMGYNETISIQQTHNQITEETVPVLENLYIIQFEGANIIDTTNEILQISPDNNNSIDQEMNQIAKFSEIYERSFKIYEIEVNTYFPDEKEYLENIRTTMQDIMRLSSELIYLKKQGNNESQIKEKGLEIAKSENEFITEVNLALESEKIELAGRTEQTESEITRLRINSWIVGLISFFMALTLGFFLSNRISAPIIKLKNVCYKIGEGNLDTQIEINSNDEIEYLGNKFSQMAKKLKNSLNETTIAIAEQKTLNPNLTVQIITE
jgi:HAMP domain-containing protein